eukprot:11178078-Lingulodinium_polyedra.AAC.1
MLKEWVENLVMEYGDGIKQWPKVGCEANFVPWRKGASMVIKMKTKYGEWLSFMVGRLPSQLDDAIKGVRA